MVYLHNCINVDTLGKMSILILNCYQYIYDNNLFYEF